MSVPFKAVLLCTIVLCGSAFWALAQTDNPAAIRSQTNDTLVPVLVLDKSQALKFHHMEPVKWRKQVTDSGYKMWESIAVANLRRADFKLYEDGKEQEIDSVTPENEDSDQYLANNFGRYWQAAGLAGGAWSIPDLPLAKDVTPKLANGEHVYWVASDSTLEQVGRAYLPWDNPPTASNSSPMSMNLPPLPWYMIAYTPPPSPPGSCHRVEVKVDRSNSLIYSRSEYCNVSDSAADALAGTKLGDQLKADLLSEKKNAIPLRITAVPVFTATGASRIQLFVDAEPDAVSIDCDSYMDGSGIVGLIYSKDGRLVRRFSDGLFYAPGENSMYWDTEWFAPASWLGPVRGFGDGMGVGCSDLFYEPTRYQTQLNLASGTYQLKVGLWNGHKFGRAEFPLTVDSSDPTKLAIGGLALVGGFRKVRPDGKVLPRSLADQFPPLIAKGIEIIPAADARVKKQDPVYFYLQVYEPQDAGAQQLTVSLHLQIRDVKTAKIVEQSQPLDAGPFTTPENPVIPIVSGINITKLAPGSYELQAQVTDSTGAITPWQSAYFTVEKLSPNFRPQEKPSPLVARVPNGSAQIPAASPPVPRVPNGSAQMPAASPPIKATTRLITVYVEAKDSHGHVVRGLTESDFKVYDSAGGFQDIAHFNFVDAGVPQTGEPKQSSAPGVSSNATTEQIAPTVLLMDALNTETKQQMAVRRDMLAVLEKLPPNTPVAVFLLEHKLRVLQNFTTDPTTLRAALQKVISPTKNEKNPQYDPDSPSNVALDSGLNLSPALIDSMQDSDKRRYEAAIQERAEETAHGMSAIATILRGFPGRKNLVWFSEAFPIWIEPNPDFGPDPFSGSGTFESEERAAAASLMDVGVAVYPADARGLQPDQVFSADERSAPAQLGPKGDTGALKQGNDLRLDSQATLQRMADDTGGHTCENTNNLGGCVIRALDEDAPYYEVSYYPTNVKWDNRFHKVTVQTSKRGIHLAYRRGYIATIY